MGLRDTALRPVALAATGQAGNPDSNVARIELATPAYLPYAPQTDAVSAQPRRLRALAHPDSIGLGGAE